MSGWIYCITNSLYKMDDMYKLGYTSNKKTEELVKKHLIQRYGTYFPNVECIDLFEVKQPIQAEKQLFELLKDYKCNNEIFKGDYEIIIKPQIEVIKNIYSCNNNNRIITEEEKNKYRLKLLKKVNYFILHLSKIQYYITSQLHKFNKHNSQLLSNVYNCLSYYNNQLFPVQNKKILTACKKDTINQLSSYIQQFDYSDLEMLSLVNNIINLLLN